MNLGSVKKLINYISGATSFIFILPVFELINLVRPYIFGFRSVRFYLFGLTFVLFCLFSTSINNGVYGTTFSYLGLLISSLSLASSRSSSIDSLLKAYFYTAVSIALLGIIDYFFHAFSAAFMYRNTYRTLRLSGTFQDPNFFSLFLNFAIVILFHRMVLVKRWIFLLSLLILSVAIGLTFSRGGLLSLVLLVIMFSLTKVRNYWYIFIGLGLLAIFGAYIYSEAISAWLSGLAERGSSGRSEVWEYYYHQVFSENLLGSFGYASERGVTHTHNTLLQMFDHFGLFSVFFLFISIFIIFRLPYCICLLPLILTLDTLFTRCFALMLFVSINQQGKFWK